MTATDRTNAQGLETKYYRSFVSYEIPLQPEGEISYAETEGLRSFYVGRHDEERHGIEVVKTLLRRDGGKSTWHFDKNGELREEGPRAAAQAAAPTVGLAYAKPATKTAMLQELATKTGLNKKQVAALFEAHADYIKGQLGKKG